MFLCFFYNAFAQTIIADGLYGQELLDYIVNNYKTSTTLGYTACRDTMYAVIDLKEGNQLSCIYSDYTITLDLSQDPSTDAYNKGINCEHTFPQSYGAGSEPQRSDMHHLFPCKINVNSSRGNDPFGMIPDENTDKWYWKEIVLETIPPDSIDEYAEKENDDPDKFEPREENKGNVARAMFYFGAIYNDVADSSFFEQQKDVLLQWHYYDPVDSVEYNRTWKIAAYQDSLPNPFVIDSTLARRIWYYLPSPEIINIYIQIDSIFIEWSSVEGATSYKVYSSDNPESGFEEDTTGIFNGTSWTTSNVNEKRFYYVTAHSDPPVAMSRKSKKNIIYRGEK